MTALPPLREILCLALCLALCLVALAYQPRARAHFQLLIPSTELVTEESGSRIGLELLFTHPMAGGPVMSMEAPLEFGVLGPHGREDLLATLAPVEVASARAFRAEYRVRGPGDHLFYLVPRPYWEAAEGKMIQHYTKVVVDAYGGRPGWQDPVGMPVEIEPLVRPYGLWVGNLFRGLVRYHGRPVANAMVEVEWRNDGSLHPPAEAFLTQIVKTDAQGVFSYAMPRAGWWGFAALLEDTTTATGPDGGQIPLELGGVIWVRTREMR